jgi:hypothetical protein
VNALTASNNFNKAVIILQPAAGFDQRSFPNGRACLQWLVGGNTCFTQSDFDAATDLSGGGRNAFRGPGFFGGDMSLRKKFELISEDRLSLEIGANAFNVFNHTNVGAPWSSTTPELPFGGAFFTATPPTSPYGAFAAAATDMRMAQIVAKLVF